MLDPTSGRERQLRLGIMSAVVFRVTSAIGPLVAIPIGYGYLGTDTFAVWMVAAGLTAFLAFADLGLGNNLMSRLAVLQATEPGSGAARALLSETYSLVGAVAVSLGLLVGVVWALAPIDVLVGLPTLRGEDRYVVIVCALVFLANVPASLVVRVMFGLQMSALSYLIQAVGPVLSVLAMLAGVLARAPGPVVVLGAVSGPLVVNVLTTIWLFGRASHLRPRLTLLRPAAAWGTLRNGGAFLAISVVIAISGSVDLALIPHFLTSEQVATYAVAWRVWTQVGMVSTLITLPFWPAAGDALARGDGAWVTARVRRLMGLNAVVVLTVLAVLVGIGPQLIEVWLGQDSQVGRWLLGVMGLWWLALAMTYPIFMVQNAVNVLRPQLVGWLVFVLVSVPLRYVAMRAGADATALPLVAVGVWSLTVIPSAVVGYRRALRVGPSVR